MNGYIVVAVFVCLGIIWRIYLYRSYLNEVAEKKSAEARVKERAESYNIEMKQFEERNKRERVMPNEIRTESESESETETEPEPEPVYDIDVHLSLSNVLFDILTQNDVYYDDDISVTPPHITDVKFIPKTESDTREISLLKPASESLTTYSYQSETISNIESAGSVTPATGFIDEQFFKNICLGVFNTPISLTQMPITLCSLVYLITQARYATFICIGSDSVQSIVSEIISSASAMKIFDINMGECRESSELFSMLGVTVAHSPYVPVNQAIAFSDDVGELYISKKIEKVGENKHRICFRFGFNIFDPTSIHLLVQKHSTP